MSAKCQKRTLIHLTPRHGWSKDLRFCAAGTHPYVGKRDVPADRIRPLGILMIQAMSIVKRMGVGSAKALRGVDFTLPAGA
jgi:hypothetical protein